MTETSILWTLEELTAQVALALADETAQASGRVREVPDQRTIRYYTTLGILDRPAAWRRHTALYGPRHLLQVVAIKRLQAEGMTLAEVQKRLLGLGDDELRKLARIPTAVDAGASTPRPGRRAKGRREGAFWEERPAETKPEQEEEIPETAIQGIPLTKEVTLLLTTTRALRPDDLEAIRAAAAPLLKLLDRRRIVKTAPRKEDA